MVRIYKFTVTGKGSFPFSCLNFDQAWPATPQDADRIEMSCPTQAPEFTITLASHAHPTPKVWAMAKWPIKRVLD